MLYPMGGSLCPLVRQLVKPLYTDFELTVDECSFGMYQAFQKCITLYFAPSLSMDCTVASCVLLTGSGKYSKNIEWQNLF